MGLAGLRKPEGLLLHEARSKGRSENAIQKCDSIGVTHKCDEQAQLTSAINMCDLQE